MQRNSRSHCPNHAGIGQRPVAAGLAFDSAGNLYAANVGSDSIIKFNLSGVGSVFADGNDGVSRPDYLAFTDDAGVPLKLANQVPEPTTGAMLTIGFPALLGFRRRK